MESKRFFLRHPLLAALLLPILAEVWVSIPSILPMLVGLQNDEKVMLITYLLCVVFAILLLLIHKGHYRPAYLGSFRKEGLKDSAAWISIGIFLAADLACYIFQGFRHGFYAFDLTYLIPSLNAGVCEETVFRAIPLSVIMFSHRKKKSSWPALIMTACIFGLFHLANLKSGAAMSITILQVIAAGISGLMLGALYLRTGNILLPMILHMVHNFISFLGIGGYSALVIDVTGEVITMEIILAVVELICIIILMKDQDKVHIPVWEERWSGTKEENR